jgi:GMP synthase (glutamine-hydrolysing)
MKTVVVLQHAEPEAPGLIRDALSSAGHSIETVQGFRGEAVPASLAGAAGLVVMGGPMGVYETDRFPFLRDEIRLIEAALRAEKPVLGVCLGSQLLAAVLGSSVTKGSQKEIGWFRVELTDSARDDQLLAGIPSAFVACHWHGDVFDLPAGAERLASSERTRVQAFRYGQHAYGFLFHMEVTPQTLEGMVKTFGSELAEASVSGEEILRQAAGYLRPLQDVGRRAFAAWASLLH